MTNMELPFAKKSLGQHWLTNPMYLGEMCAAAEVGSGDVVLEIGPGFGTLTHELVGRAKEVIAVEFDAALASELPKRVSAPNLTIVQQDIMKFDLTSLPAAYKVVANIPYYLTSNLIRVLSEASNPPSLAVLLVQKEVAERVAAKPGDMSLLSVTAQWYWQVQIGKQVPAKEFTPPPKVDSQILILRRREVPLFSNTDTKVFFRIVKAGFSQRRKTLLNSLSSGLHLTREQTVELLNKSNISPDKRPQTLSLDQWHAIYINLTR